MTITEDYRLYRTSPGRRRQAAPRRSLWRRLAERLGRRRLQSLDPAALSDHMQYDLGLSDIRPARGQGGRS